MNAPLLAVNGVTLQYKTPRHLVTATYRVDFSVHQGDRYVILGPSGCGKSTLLKAVGGFMPPVEGSIRIRGKDIVAPGPDRMMVFQEFEQLMPWKTVFGNVYLPLKLRGISKAAARDRIMDVLATVGLQDFAEAYPRELSGGMKMRVSIARALVTKPKLLLMDEPFAALDEITRQKLNDDVLRLWKTTGITVIFVTHSVFESAYLSNRIVVMKARPGRVHADIPLATSLERDAHYRTSEEYRKACETVSYSLIGAINAAKED